MRPPQKSQTLKVGVCFGRWAAQALILGLTLVLPVMGVAAPKLNVLFIVADDLNNNLGCYGHAIVKSPNIDRLAARGVRFDRAYCQYPVCNPSRTSLLSGRRPDNTRVIDNVTPPRTHLQDVVFLPQYFRMNGYTSLKVGKIFHTGEAMEDARSWDVDIPEQKESKTPPTNQVLRTLGAAGVLLQAKDEETWDGFVARKAAALMEQAARSGKSFFVAAGFRRPHAPYLSPEKYYALYHPAELRPRSGPIEHLSHIPKFALTYRLGEKALPNETAGETMAAYYASISFMDAQVGVLLDTLDRLKLWEQTVVVFFGDHGYHLGEHGGLWHKMTLFEEACRVPLIVAAPGKPGGAAANGLVELVDLYPTLAELCGLPKVSGLEGMSLVSLLENPKRPGKKAAFTVAARKLEGAGGGQPESAVRLGRSVRTERWRFTEWPDGTAELYDHDVDPFEYANLANLPEQAAVVVELKKLVEAK